MAISLPLRSFGLGSGKAFWYVLYSIFSLLYRRKSSLCRYGQLSGLVEVVAGLIGVCFVQLANCLLPFALSFAAGAMLFVVFNEIIPEISS